MSSLGGIRAGVYLSGRVADRGGHERLRLLRPYYDWWRCGCNPTHGGRPPTLVWEQSGEEAERRRERRERR